MNEVVDFADDSVWTLTATHRDRHTRSGSAAVQDFDGSAKLWSLSEESVKMAGTVIGT